MSVRMNRRQLLRNTALAGVGVWPAVNRVVGSRALPQ